MKDTHPRLPIALILSYKRSAHTKRKRELSHKGKPAEKNKRKTEIKREIEG